MKFINGALGTELIERLGSQKVLDRYSLTHKFELEQIYRSYIKSGAKLLYTCTFNSCYPFIEKNECDDIHEASLEIINHLQEDYGQLKSVLSIGGGRLSLSRGEVSYKQLVDGYLHQLQFSSRTNYVILETIYDFENYKAFKEAYFKLEKKPKLFLSTCLTSLELLHNLYDDAILLDPVGIGINCVEDSAEVREVLLMLKDRYQKSIIYYPNSFLFESLNLDVVDFFGTCCSIKTQEYAKVINYVKSLENIKF